MKSLLFALLAAFAGAAGAVERAVPYAKLHEMFQGASNMQGAKYVKAGASLGTTDNSVEPGAIKLVVKSKSGDIAVPIDAAGRAAFPLRDDLLAENPDVLVNVAEGKMSFMVTLSVDAPPVERFRYALMVDMLDEYEALIAKQSFTTRMMAPDYEGLMIVFPTPTSDTAIVESSDGEARFKPDDKGRIVIPDKRAWRAENPWVKLSSLPAQITLAPE